MVGIEYTLSIYHFICQLYLKKAEKIFKVLNNLQFKKMKAKKNSM